MKRWSTILSLFLFAIGFVPVFGQAATIHVPSDYLTIQEAIDAAMNGDTVLVGPGTYVENIGFLGKAITVKSCDGAEATVIDGGDPMNPDCSVVSFKSGESTDAVLDGFTITNGTGTGHGSWPHNFVTGGGIDCYYSSPTIKNNIITGNIVWNWGGGISCYYSSSIITNNIISDNMVIGCGGGICCLDGSPTITNNAITGNKAGHAGISGWGGGIGCAGSSATITNNTLSGNSAEDNGGGIFCWAYASPMITNTIMWNNSAPKGPEVSIEKGSYPSILTISCSDVKGGQASCYIDPGCSLNWGLGMIDADPLFVDPLNNDFHLTSLSPCINRGTNNGAPSGDIDGDVRPYMGTIDMGADEYAGIHPLEADVFSVSEATGGMVNFELNTGTVNCGRTYLVLGSLSGTAPGTPLPKGYATLRLNWDQFTSHVLGALNTPACMGFCGTLDGLGSASAQLNVPPVPGFAGTCMHYAYCLMHPFDFVSNPIAVKIVP